MSLIFILHAGFQLFLIKLVAVFANHLISIPMALLLGLGKYMAFFIAVLIDFCQIFLYYNVLNQTRIGNRFNWALNTKALTDKYKKPAFMERLHHSWSYLGVCALSLLPVYLGGIFVAVFTAHLLKLNKTKGLICICLGSVIGCFIWTVGLWTLVDWGIRFFVRF